MNAILAAEATKRNRLPERMHSRPSLLDPFLPGDPCMVACSLPGVLVLDLRNCPVALQPGTRLDQAAFNAWIFRLRSGTPRNGMATDLA